MRFALLAWVLLPAAYVLVTLAGTGGRPAEALPSDPVAHTLPAAGPRLQEPSLPDAYCLTCHGDESLSAGFSDGRALSLYVDLRAIRDSAHELLPCVTCHDTYDPPPPERTEPYDFAVYQAEATAMCSRCHAAAAEGYATSAHSETVLKEGEGATCLECHSPDGSGHSIARTSDPGLFLGAERIAGACGSCHAKALSTYRDTSHGKVERFGNAKHTATCTTCHADHAVQPADDLLETNATALAHTCAECHDGADEDFARAWPGHSTGAPARSAANLAGRAGLLVSAAVVAFGLVHVTLDLYRRRAGTKRRGS